MRPIEFELELREHLVDLDERWLWRQRDDGELHDAGQRGWIHDRIVHGHEQQRIGGREVWLLLEAVYDRGRVLPVWSQGLPER